MVRREEESTLDKTLKKTPVASAEAWNFEKAQKRHLSRGVMCSGLNFRKISLLPLLKLQYFGHLMQRADSFEKTLMLGKD